MQDSGEEVFLTKIREKNEFGGTLLVCEQCREDGGGGSGTYIIQGDVLSPWIYGDRCWQLVVYGYTLLLLVSDNTTGPILPATLPTESNVLLYSLFTLKKLTSHWRARFS